jgi:holo-[acyl-carrier protein] synthase
MILGIGIDIIHVRAVRAALAHYGNTYTEEIFTADERSYCESTSDPAQRYAARFAAKEACMKALGTGWSTNIQWTDIAVDHSPSGAPSIMLSGAAAFLAQERGVVRYHLSLAHTTEFAIAEVLLESN